MVPQKGEVPGEHPSLRFPRRQRLTDDDFVVAVRAGKVLRGQGVAVLLKKTGDGIARFGIVVPKRIVPRAVDRNRSKRILREWFRHNSRLLHGMDCVIRVTASTKGKASEDATISEIERLLAPRP